MKWNEGNRKERERRGKWRNQVIRKTTNTQQFLFLYLSSPPPNIHAPSPCQEENGKWMNEEERKKESVENG
jgi:hypothetical protein